MPIGEYTGPMNVVVFGAGSLGSLIGGLLARAHDVTLLGRAPHMEAVRRSGLELTGEIELVVDPDARTDAPLAADLAVVTTKAFDTESAARALEGRTDCVLSLQNGMGNEEVLRAELDCVLAGTCTYGALYREPGVVRCTGCGEVVLGTLPERRSERNDRSDRDDRDDGTDRADCSDCSDRATADRVGAAFREAGIETTVAEDMTERLWEKLAVNTAINPVTALTGTPNGALRTGEAHRLATGAARETARVARTQGVDLAEDRALAALEDVIETTAGNDSSMLQDVQQGRRTEIDAISGYVADRASESVPITETLRDLVRTWERERGLR
jgi:2-dehydropantoate 2-reductase